MLNLSLNSLATRDCRDVIAALLVLGCEIANETPRHFFVCRGAVKMVTVAKMMTTGPAQYGILGAHDITEGEYVKALAVVLNRAAAERA